jgi:glycosyltransferase involved in cell wall biosynthesis
MLKSKGPTSLAASVAVDGEKARAASNSKLPSRTIAAKDEVSSRPKKQNGPLVSVLIPAYNAEKTIADTLRSVLSQTWTRKEIIVVNDGSKDATLEVLREFEPYGVKVITQQNQGAAIARNKAFECSSGDYIQWLDADDLLAPEKIELQLAACDWLREKRILLSGPWAQFLHRQSHATLKVSGLWQSLSPTEWLVRKLRDDLFMPLHGWLVSRELTEAAGPWDVRLVRNDDDGEYFCRVLLASEGVRFVPNATVYYRSPGVAFLGLSYVGTSQEKLEAYWLSLQLHIDYLFSLEQSDRTREAALHFLQSSMIYFYPERPDLVDLAQELAHKMGGVLVPPRLSWKYAWLRVLFGWKFAKTAMRFLQRAKWTTVRRIDKLLMRSEDNSHSAMPEVKPAIQQ